jgi:YidC/Oxa1 family membrane protein insertase
MIAMQRVQPEIKRLQAKYKNDRQKLNEEMMKFYKENDINPLGGCLPLVLQMPIFIALFQTLHNIQKFIPVDSKMYQDICGKGVQVSKCKPKMSFAGLDLTKSASTVASKGFAEVWPYLILVAIVVVTGFVQQRQTMRNQSQPNPQMAMVGKIFPIIFAFISWTAASGVALYFATTNLWQIGQQEIVYRTIVSADGPPPKIPPDDEGSSGSRSKPDRSTGNATKSKDASGGPRAGSKGEPKPSTKPDGSANGSNGSRPGQARSNRKRKR